MTDLTVLQHPDNLARIFESLRDLALHETTEPNDAWSTVYHVAQDALEGHTRTLDDL